MTNEQLVTLIKDGIDASDNMLQIWQQNRKFIAVIAGKYQGYEDIEDLKQQGYIGLCSAVDSYRPEESVPFINYAAFWIRQSMMRYIENCGSVVRIPTHERQRQGKYKKLLYDFEAQTGREPTDWEICRCMQISRRVLEEIKNNAGMGQIGSLDSYVGEDGDNTVGDMIPGDTDIEGFVLDKIEREELEHVIWSVVDTLPGNQPQVIRSLYREGNTLKATGKIIGGVSVERVRTIKQRAIRELRRPSRSNRLIAFLPEAVGGAIYRHNGIEEFERTWTSSTERAALKMYEEITGHVFH